MMFDARLIDELVQREMHKQIAQERMIAPAEEKSFQPTPLDPKIAMLLGGVADSVSTLGFLKNGSGRTESNPMFKYFNSSPWTVVPTAVGAGYGYTFLHKLLSKMSPKTANTMAGLLGGYQGAVAARNFQSTSTSRNAAALATEDLHLGRR